MRVGVARALADSSDFGLLGKQSSQNGRFLALDADDRRAKFDTASFILSEKIRNRTNEHTQKNRQSVTDISTCG